MAKPKYFEIDTGFFPQIVKLVFSDEGLQEVFADSQIAVGVRAFEHGEAETHTIHTHLGDMIIIAINPDNYEEDDTETNLIGVIAHECSHALERLGIYLGEDNIAGETRAYLLQSFVEQVYSASLIEREERARKRSRKSSNKKDKSAEGSEPKVDLDDNGSARSDSDPKPKNKVRRTKNTKGDDIPETEDSVSTARGTGVSSHGASK